MDRATRASACAEDALEGHGGTVNLPAVTLFRTWWPWIALAAGLLIVALGGFLFSPGPSP